MSLLKDDMQVWVLALDASGWERGVVTRSEGKGARGILYTLRVGASTTYRWRKSLRTDEEHAQATLTE